MSQVSKKDQLKDDLVAFGYIRRLVDGGVPALELVQYLENRLEVLYFSEGQSLIIRESPLTGMYCHGKVSEIRVNS